MWQNERPTIKAINFDFDTHAMKDYGVYPNGYGKVGESLSKYGFEHRQGSGYISKGEISDKMVVKVIRKVIKENPWIGDCVKKLDVTNVGRQFDMTNMVKRTARLNAARAASNNTRTSTKVADSKTIEKNNQNFME